jgi:hypothetical protein
VTAAELTVIAVAILGNISLFDGSTPAQYRALLTNVSQCGIKYRTLAAA